jgi:hypothetical protein
MKRLILVSAILLIAIFHVNAQKRAEAKANYMVDHISQVCTLSPDQAEKLYPVAENYIQTRKANKQQYANDPETLKNANKTATINYRTQLKTILSREQMEKLKAYNTQQRANRKGPRGSQEDNGEQPDPQLEQ